MGDEERYATCWSPYNGNYLAKRIRKNSKNDGFATMPGRPGHFCALRPTSRHLSIGTYITVSDQK